ncbi:MAG: UDP-N-acetylmuramoyl-tripeptide--D-alanyl-D-alanine ligase [Candidatus Peregrinibacteria bacterium]|nr:UDP-N-acetylmuramoyl-tripeptide--D-alanyl-D-alanine ligase [Candidatus Peregrinibacteria bacterium]
MKTILKNIISSLLAFRARGFLKKHRVQVIAVTGSIGKTSTRAAIYTVLQKRFKAHSSKKSFNTELGVSLAILQEDESGFTSPIAWLKILWRAFFVKKPLYQKIVLEMGADKPGDIKKLMRIAPPRVSVVTNVNPVHLGEGQFKDMAAIAKEKGTLVKYLPKTGVAILNFDDPYVRQMETKAAKFTYTLNEPGMLKAQHVQMTAKDIRFEVVFKGQTEKFKVPVIGEFQVYVLLPAIAVGLQMGMSLKECAEALSEFRLPAGRMNPIEGVNRTQIIDGSYNASPSTVAAALELLPKLKATRKIAALGMMNELGDYTHEAHLEIGQKAASTADWLVAVGQEAPTMKKGAMLAGMKESDIFTFFDSEEAGHFLCEKLRLGDLVLVKGSQNKVRMEKLVKLIMKHPELASSLLCRQEKAWD